MGLFQLYHADGSLQLDSDLMTYAYVRKGTVQTQTAWAAPLASSTAYIPINLNSTELTAVRIDPNGQRGDGTGNGVGLARFTTTQYQNQNCDVYQSDAVPGTNVTYYVFDRAQYKPASGFGLELFDGSGNMTFSSNQRPMVAGFWQGLSGGAVSFYYGDGRTYATLMSIGAYSSTTYSHDLQSQDNYDSKGRLTSTDYWYDFSTYAQLGGGPFQLYGGTATPYVVPYQSGGGRYPVANANTPPPADQVNYDVRSQYQLLVDVTGL